MALVVHQQGFLLHHFQIRTRHFVPLVRVEVRVPAAAQVHIWLLRLLLLLLLPFQRTYTLGNGQFRRPAIENEVVVEVVNSNFQKILTQLR